MFGENPAISGKNPRHVRGKSRHVWEIHAKGKIPAMFGDNGLRLWSAHQRAAGGFVILHILHQQRVIGVSQAQLGHQLERMRAVAILRRAAGMPAPSHSARSSKPHSGWSAAMVGRRCFRSEMPCSIKSLAISFSSAVQPSTAQRRAGRAVS